MKLNGGKPGTSFRKKKLDPSQAGPSKGLFNLGMLLDSYLTDSHKNKFKNLALNFFV